MSSRLNTKESINSYKIWSCCMKNKFKVKPRRSQWLKSSMLQLFKPKPLILKKWWPKKEHLKHKSKIRTNKSKLWTSESKRWQVSTRDKFLSCNKKFKKFGMTIKNGSKDKTSKLNNGTMNAPKQKKKFTSWIFSFKTLKQRTNNWNNHMSKKFHRRTWKSHHFREICRNTRPKFINFNQRFKLKLKTLKRLT